MYTEPKGGKLGTKLTAEQRCFVCGQTIPKGFRAYRANDRRGWRHRACSALKAHAPWSQPGSGMPAGLEAQSAPVLSRDAADHHSADQTSQAIRPPDLKPVEMHTRQQCHVCLQVMAVGTMASWSSRQRRWRHTGCSVGRTGNGFRA